MVNYLDKVIELREQKKSYTEIGEMLKKSRAWVGWLINEHRPDLAGREISEDRPELEDKIQEPDELKSLKASAKTSRILALRINRDGKKVKDAGVNLSVRRRMLVKKLWEGKIPGPNFPSFLGEEVFTALQTDHQRMIFENFYLLPVDESTKEKPNRDSDKAIRSWIITNVLPEIIKTFNIKDLLERKVLKHGRKTKIDSSNIEGDGSQSSDTVGSQSFRNGSSR